MGKMASVRLACHAMATRFELLLAGDDEAQLRAAGEEAVTMIHRLEAQLSFYRPTSDIGRINARAACDAVAVEPALFLLLQRARELHAATAGMFDITVGPLMRCWRFVGDTGSVPAAAELDEARQRVGMQHIELDAVEGTVRFARAGVELDLGGIAKGYALDRAAVVLRDAGVEHALLHGGTSSIVAFGTSHDEQPWKVAVEQPRTDGAAQPLAVVTLHNRALSVSAVWGKAFSSNGQVYGHVMDPRLGRPVNRAVLAAAVCDSATDADAVATALLALGATRARSCLSQLPGTFGLVVTDDDVERGRVSFSQGIDLIRAGTGLHSIVEAYDHA
jgi:FAD:protein FMN transferase